MIRRLSIVLLSLSFVSFSFFGLVFLAYSAPPGGRLSPGNTSRRGGGRRNLNRLKCPDDPKARQRKLMEAYKKLLAVMATGEGGKMDTPEKREAYEVYRFYARCYASGEGTPANAASKSGSLLKACRAGWDASRHLLPIDMDVAERVPYESLKRVEVSIRSAEGKEFFRAMVNRSSACAPIPPNAFGLFPVGEKAPITLKDVRSAGHGAAIPVKAKYGSLAPGCGTSWEKGVLRVRWKIRFVFNVSSKGPLCVFTRIVSGKDSNGKWHQCATVP